MRSNFFRLVLFLLIAIGPRTQAAGLVICGDDPNEPCRFADLYRLFNKVVNFLIFDLGVPLAILAIVASGIQLVWNRDKSTAQSVWKNRIQKALLGLIIIMCAYLLVKAVVWGLTEGSDKYNLRDRVK